MSQVKAAKRPKRAPKAPGGAALDLGKSAHGGASRPPGEGEAQEGGDHEGGHHARHPLSPEDERGHEQGLEQVAGQGDGVPLPPLEEGGEDLHEHVVEGADDHEGGHREQRGGRPAGPGEGRGPGRPRPARAGRGPRSSRAGPERALSRSVAVAAWARCRSARWEARGAASRKQHRDDGQEDEQPEAQDEAQDPPHPARVPASPPPRGGSAAPCARSRGPRRCRGCWPGSAGRRGGRSGPGTGPRSRRRS